MGQNNSSGNSMTTLLLMGAVVLLFMWLNRPKPVDRNAVDQLNDPVEASAVLNADTLTSAQVANICNVVRQNGVADTLSNSYTLRDGNSVLTVSGDGKLTGDMVFDGGRIPVTELLTANHGSLTPKQAARAIGQLLATVDHAARYQEFAPYTHGDSTTVMLQNDLLTLDISNKGGMIVRAALRDPRYIRYDSTAVEPIVPSMGGYSFTLTTSNQRFYTDEFYFTPVEVTDTSVTMQLNLGDGAMWGLRYTLLPGSYCVRMDVVQEGMGAVLPQSTAEMEFAWNGTMHRNEAGRMFEERNSALYYKFAGGGVEHLSEMKDDKEDVSEKMSWIGFKNQFFSTILVARDNFTSANLSSEVLKDDPEYIKKMSVDGTIDYSVANSNPASFTFYIGPNSYPLLSEVQEEIFPGNDLKFTKVIPLGWSLFRWINTLVVIPVFTFLGKFISSYGLIIFLLTIFIKLILFPFTYKSYMSQARMRVLAPEINAINEKYPGNENAMKRQQETMALYSKAGASPFAGCLPMLLQMPILVAMFNFFPSAIELRGQSFLWAHDLSAPDAVLSWTTNIPLISSTFGNHISLFCLLMTVTNIIYTRTSMQSQPTGNTMPAMKWMMYLMPLMFLFWFNNYAAGLSYYYFLSLLITIIQTYIFRKVVDEHKVRARMQAQAAKPRKKSGFMARLEEAQRRQQAMLREQEKRQGGKRR